MTADTESLSTNGLSINVDMATEPQADEPTVIVVNAPAPTNDDSSSLVDIASRVGAIEERLATVESVAVSASDSAETAIAIAEVAAVEPEPEVEVIPDEPTEDEAPSDESDVQKPQREHWLWKNPKNWRRKP